MTSRFEQATASGAHGAKGSLPLVDVLQVWSMNRFSGLVAVTFQGRVGHLYFVEGEIVHAEADEVVGEPAVGVILGWPDGSFEPFPNTATLKRTITKRLSHLLLDAHRVLDEQRRVAAPAPAPAAAAPPPVPSVVDRIRSIPGVTQAVRFGADGRTAASEGPAGEALAGRALYLALNPAAAVAAAFGLRDLVVGSLQGPRESFLVVHGGGNYLGIAVGQGVAMEAVVAQVRGQLVRPGAR